MALNPDNMIVLELKHGKVIIELLPDLAPKHVARFKKLIEQHFYDGLNFHRVIKDFMAQTGCPNGDGRGGSGVKLKDEISGAHHVRGMISSANAGPNTDDSQFFITFVDCRWLDNKHTIFGRVVNGMEFIDKINDGGTQTGNPPKGQCDKIESLQLLKNTDMKFEDIIDYGPTMLEYGPTEQNCLHESSTSAWSFLNKWFG